MLVQKLCALTHETTEHIFAYRYKKNREHVKTYREKRTLELYKQWTTMITPTNANEIVNAIDANGDDDFPIFLSYLLERCEIPYDIIPSSCVLLQMIPTHACFYDVVRTLASKTYIPVYLLELVQREAYHTSIED